MEGLASMLEALGSIPSQKRKETKKENSQAQTQELTSGKQKPPASLKSTVFLNSPKDP